MSAERVTQPKEEWIQLSMLLEAYGGIQGYTLRTVAAAQEQPLGRRLVDGLMAGYEAKYIRFPKDDKEEAAVFVAGFLTGYNMLLRQTEDMLNGKIDMKIKVGVLGDVLNLLSEAMKLYEETELAEHTPYERLQELGTSGFPLFEGLNTFIEKHKDDLQQITMKDCRTGGIIEVKIDEQKNEIYSLGFGAGATTVYRIRSLAGISNTHQQDVANAENRAIITRGLETMANQPDEDFQAAVAALIKNVEAD